MADSSNYRRGRRRRRRGILGRLISFVVICLVLFAGISVFFKLSVIEVDGDTRYSEEEIIEASGVDYGDHLFFLNRSTIANSIRQNLPYVDEVALTRRFPNTLEITVTDGAALAAISTDNGYLLLDRHCKVLEITDYQGAEDKIHVTGVTPILPETGKTIALGEEERAKVTYLSELLTLLEDNGIAEDVEDIDLTLVGDLTFSYMDRFKVRLGGNRDLAYKIKLLIGTVNELEDYDTGTIDLSEGEPARFSPG